MADYDYVLRPNIYKQNMKWSLKPSNKIDTISAQPMENTLSTETENFHTVSFTSGLVDGTNMSLPLSASTKPTYVHWVTNSISPVDYAKGRIDCVIAKGSRRITLDKPVQGIPQASISFQGISHVVDRITGGENTDVFESYPSVTDMQNYDYSLSNWISDNKVTTKNTLTHTYSDNKITFMPWVRRIVPSDRGGDWNATTPNDILTRWTKNEFFEGSAAYDVNWNEGANADILNPFAVTMAQDDTTSTQVYLGTAPDFYIKLAYSAINITVKVSKISDTIFDIEWEAPVMVAYAAASRYFGFFGAEHHNDSFAYVDYITSVDVSIFGTPLSTDTTDVSFGLDNNGNLTENTKNLHILKLTKSEILTRGTYMYDASIDHDWLKTVSKDILAFHKDGKYVVTCEVPASWAIPLKIGVGTRVIIQLQDGTYINRNGANVIFEVKNKETRYRANEFMCELKLSEWRTE